VIVLFVIGVVVTSLGVLVCLSACMLSSRISREDGA
jgi:hypothetical protein